MYYNFDPKPVDCLSTAEDNSLGLSGATAPKARCPRLVLARRCRMTKTSSITSNSVKQPSRPQGIEVVCHRCISSDDERRFVRGYCAWWAPPPSKPVQAGRGDPPRFVSAARSYVPVQGRSPVSVAEGYQLGYQQRKCLITQGAAPHFGERLDSLHDRSKVLHALDDLSEVRFHRNQGKTDALPMGNSVSIAND